MGVLQIKRYHLLSILMLVFIFAIIYMYFHLYWPGAQTSWMHIRHGDRSCQFLTTYVAQERGYSLDDDNVVFVRYNPADPADCWIISGTFPFTKKLEQQVVALLTR